MPLTKIESTIPADLVEHLRFAFPDTLRYSRDKEPRDYAYEAGCRYVVDYITKIREAQQKGNTHG